MIDTTVTRPQREVFGRQGFVHLRKLIPLAMVEELRNGYDEVASGRLEVEAWKGRIAAGEILQLGLPYKNIPGWQEHPFMARIVDVGKELMGPDIEYKYDQLIYKPPCGLSQTSRSWAALPAPRRTDRSDKC